MQVNKIAILDCGGQYTKVIDRKVREMGVKSEIFPISIKPEALKEYDGIILSGGPGSVWNEQALEYDEEILSLGKPVFGICYGMQLINKHFEGVVSPGVKKEYGETIIDIDISCPLFAGLQDSKQMVLMSHGDSVEVLAKGFKVSAKSGDVVAGIYNEELKIYGVQFHPEVDLTENGKQMLENFIKNICGLEGNYVLEDRINTAIEKIREKVKDDKVLVLVSGGVDSAVSAVLLVKALGPEKVYAIHIDHGFMRKNESDIICENLHELGITHLIRKDAEETFFNTKVELNGEMVGPLTTLVDPEEKRQVIGDIFIKVVREVADSLNLDFDKTFIAQGTLRPDLIESGNPDVSSYAHKIKTHHNDVDIIRKAREKGLIIETNWDWHKDEVRKVARKLGIEESVAERQPFPGPGLAIRTICNDCSSVVTEQQKTELKALLNNMGTSYDCQAVPIKTVGVQGDCRSYRHLAIASGAGMDFNWDDLYLLGREIPNKVNFINRIAYALNKDKIDQEIKCYEMYLNKQNADLLRELDYYVTKTFDIKNISQSFCVLLPIGIEKKYSVGIRTFITNDFMTGRPAFIGKDISKEAVAELVKEIESKFSEIDLILYDITGKPPATVEWQ